VTDDVNKEESIIIADKKTNTRLAFSLTYRLSWSSKSTSIKSRVFFDKVGLFNSSFQIRNNTEIE